MHGIFWLAVVLGVLARGVVATRGYNFDVQSYRIVADIVAAAGNVYQDTARYNYGPIWFYLLGALDALPGWGIDPLISLRWKVTGLLTLVDVAIALTLRTRWGALPAMLFIVNPVSIVITGYHSQFDNLAILIGLLAVLALERRSTGWQWLVLGLSLMGLSLSTKHILFLFPLWMAMRETSWRSKLTVVALPYALFALGFVPYIHEGWKGIVDNVLLYRSFKNGPFWLGVMPAALTTLLPLMGLFVGTMLLLGLIWRRKSLVESFFLYLVALVVFASAIANQYLAICMVTIAIWPNWPYVAYTVATTVYLATSKAGLHIWALQSWLGSTGENSLFGYQRLILLLALGLCWQGLGGARRRRVTASFRRGGAWLGREIRGQLKNPW